MTGPRADNRAAALEPAPRGSVGVNMLRPFAAALVFACIAMPAAAQERPADELVLLVMGPDGGPAAKAHGLLTCQPAQELPVLRGLGPWPAGAVPPVEVAHQVRGTSNPRGVLRLDSRGLDTDGRAAAGLVTTEEGLGALVSRLLPGRAQRITLQPMAAVTTGSGNEAFELHARALLPTGEAVSLPVQIGTEVRLPAGLYEVWANSADGWVWQRLSLASGQRAVLRFEGEAQRLRRRNGASIHPASRPEVDLFGNRDEAVLRGAALGAPLAGRYFSSILLPQVVPGPPRQDAIDWPLPSEPPTGERLEFPFPESADTQVALITLSGTEGEQWRLLHASAMHGDRSSHGSWLETAANPSGDSWLLLLANGFAPRALPWSERSRLTTEGLTLLDHGVPLLAHARDEQGQPVRDLVVEYTPEQMEPATVVGHSDARGTAHLGPVLGPGVLKVSDPRFANQDVALAAIPQDGVQLALTDGAGLLGRIVWPDGKAAAGVTVTVRDPRGLLRPATRSVATTADGFFTFRGLPEDQDLVVFAATTRDGHTWSGRLSRARAGADSIELTVHDEDPSLVPGERR